jgi:uncharacterized membrane protein YdjX (TVP38/TMEM64 family)
MGAALVVIALVYWYDISRFISSALERVERLGPWGPVLFILIYVVATVLLIPGSALTLGAGALFGVVWGSVYVSIGATLGATCAFLVGRHLARDWVAARMARRPAFLAIDRAVAEEGWKIVGLTRLSPIFPFVLLNYAFGLTRVSLRDYVLASWIGMLPGSVMYVYVGSLARVGVNPRGRTSTEWALYGVGLAATLGVTALVTRSARRALARRANPPARHR